MKDSKNTASLNKQKNHLSSSCCFDLCLMDSFIYFDLETGGLTPKDGILQISAKIKSDIFNQYILPVGPIGKKASDITGLTYYDGVLSFHGQAVDAISIEDALRSFIDWLAAIGKCIIVGHNVTFDFRFIFHYLELYSLHTIFRELVIGYIDTLSLFKKTLPKNTSYKQEDLVKQFLVTDYNSHNALDDVIALEKLVDYFKFHQDILNQHTKSTSSYCCRKTMKNLVKLKVLTQGTADKLGNHDIDYDTLQLFFVNSDFSTLEGILGRNYQTIIDKINAHFGLEKLHEFQLHI